MKIKSFWKNKKRVLAIGTMSVLIILLLILGVVLVNKNKPIETMSNVDVYEENFDEVKLEDDLENQDIKSIDELEEVKEEVVEEEKKEEENSQTANNTDDKKMVSNKRFYIKVNNQTNTVTVYSKNQNGDYEPLKAMVCSVGTYTPTSGKYTIGSRWEWLGLFGNVFGHYVTQITGNILFHSVPYTAWGDNGTLEWWEYDKLGTKASMGCVRLQISDAKWIFENVDRGTVVEFYSDANPGPLGKPTSMKISQNEECRNYDPTDPSNNNPWKNYNDKKQQEELKKQEEKKKQDEITKKDDEEKIDIYSQNKN
ncbi:putative uncharacterized protein [Clostridium sp. CAG:1219]|nr:putative uncharacterized protein [Clostridium sp. CAG:1219]